MPHEKGTRLLAVIRRVRKYRAGLRDDARPRAQAALTFVVTVPKVFFDHRIVAERFDIFVLLRTHGTMKAVPLRKAHPDVLTPGILIVAPAFHPGGRAGTDPDQIHRTMADVVISVTEEVLGTELPIRWGGPLLNPTEDFGPPFATIAAIEHV